MKDLTELLADARQYADLTGHGALYLAPGVTTAEAHVAAWHAIAVQGGMATPENEAWRLAADRGNVPRDHAGIPESGSTARPVDVELVHKAIGSHEFLAGSMPGAVAVMDTLQQPQASAPETNARGEFIGEGGRMQHQVSVPQAPDFAIHDGEWLKCDACNPLQVLRAQATTELADLRARYDAAKQAKDKATEEFDAIKSKLLSAQLVATEGALRSALYVDGFKAMNLTYSEPWTLDTAALKAAQPAVYATYAKQGTRWTLAESRSKS